MIDYQAPTHHAICILIYLNQFEGQRVTASLIADKLGMCTSYFMRVIQQLQKAGIVISTQGRYGGFKLAKPVESISLHDVMQAMENGFGNPAGKNPADSSSWPTAQEQGEKLASIFSQLAAQTEIFLKQQMLSEII